LAEAGPGRRPRCPHKSETSFFRVTFPPYRLCRKKAFPYQPTSNPTNVTFSPVGIICQLSHYKALILRDKPLEMMEEYPVEDGALRMSGTIESLHGGRMASRNGPKSRIGPRLPGKMPCTAARTGNQSRKCQQPSTLSGGNGKRKGTDTARLYLCAAMPNAFFDSLRLPRLAPRRA